MIFKEEELDKSVSDVKEKAKRDIAEQNRDVATVRAQRLQMKEANKKRLLEQAKLDKITPDKVDLSEETDLPKVTPDLREDAPDPVTVSATVEKDPLVAPIVSPAFPVRDEKPQPITGKVESPELALPVVTPKFPSDEFLATEPGPTLKKMTADVSTGGDIPSVKVKPDLPEEEKSKTLISADLPEEGVYYPKEELIKAKKAFEAFNASVDAPKAVPSLPDDGPMPSIQDPKVYQDDPLKVRVTAKLDDSPMEPFALSPTVEQQAISAPKVKPDSLTDAPLSVDVRGKPQQDDLKVAAPDAKVPTDANYSAKAKITADDLDHFLSNYARTVVDSSITEKVRANMKTPALNMDFSVALDNTDAGKMPFVGIPAEFTNSVAAGGSDGNFSDKLAKGAVEVISNTVKEFVTDVIDEACKEFDENFLGFDLAAVLENCLENIQNKEAGPFGFVDQEFRLSSSQTTSLQDMVSKELTGSRLSYSAEADPSTQLNWDGFDAMIEDISKSLYSMTKDGAAVEDVLGAASKAWSTILNGMLTSPDYPGNKVSRGVNLAVDALVGAGPDLYKNMYDVVLLQVGDGRFLDKLPKGGDAQCSVDELMVNILGNSFLAVRAGGITIPEMKTKTVDIPILWTTVTKAVQQTEVSKKQTLSIDADQYLFMYDTLMRAAGKFVASSKYGLIDSSWENDLHGMVPVQLGTLCGKSWSDSGFGSGPGMKLSNKPRVDMLVKLRNFSPFLMGNGNVAPGQEPYFVFEDVRFLGNGSLQFSRADAARATFDTDFIFRRAYKVNVNSHSGTTEKSTLSYIGNHDYRETPDFIAPNLPLREHLADPYSDRVSDQLGAIEVDSASILRDRASSGASSYEGRSSEGLNWSSADQKTRVSASTNKLVDAKSAIKATSDINALVSTLLSRYQDSLKDVTGEQTPTHSDGSIAMKAVGPTKPETTSFKFQKPDWSPIANVITSEVAKSLGNLAQAKNGSQAPKFDESKAKAKAQAAHGAMEKSTVSVESYAKAQRVKGTIASSIRSFDESVAINNVKAEKAIGD